MFRQVVPESLVKEAVRSICDFAGAWPEDPASWLRLPPENDDVVPLHHAPALWKIRMYPAVYAAFCEIYGTERLWVSMDRARFRAPNGHARVPVSERLAWSGDPRGAHPGVVHGMLFLTDLSAESGGFRCSPAVYREIESWWRERPSADWRVPELGEAPVESVSARAGDLLVWDPRLPCSASTNLGDRPHIAQFVTMMPTEIFSDPERERRKRVRLFTERRAPENQRGWAGQPDPELAFSIELTELARKLIGFEPWG
ncbi:MAG: phytanoyl-CoA dioxygenase family protein [Bdellovibrionales bacterium]|nr:phytanoyl-CoA dioxygenase family protein [Bdellovibrionales bacterium]